MRSEATNGSNGCMIMGKSHESTWTVRELGGRHDKLITGSFDRCIFCMFVLDNAKSKCNRHLNETIKKRIFFSLFRLNISGISSFWRLLMSDTKVGVTRTGICRLKLVFFTNRVCSLISTCELTLRNVWFDFFRHSSEITSSLCNVTLN